MVLQLHTESRNKESKSDSGFLTGTTGPSASLLQNKCHDCGDSLQMNPQALSSVQMQPLEEEEEMLQPAIRMQPLGEEEEMLQPKRENGNSPDHNSIASGLNATSYGGAALPEKIGSDLGEAMGADFSNVKVHTGSESIRMNQELGARAFTYGNHIFFNKGQYNPERSSGKRLLAHELTHVAQQGHGVIRREAMPAEAGVTGLGDYGARTRQNISYDTGFDFQSVVSQFFQPGLVMDVVQGYNVTFVVRGFAQDEAWLADPLKAMALYNFNLNRPPPAEGGEEGEEAADAPPPPITNISSVQNLDLSGQTDPGDSTNTGPHARIRFTSTLFDETGPQDSRTQNVQLLIEKLGDFTPTTFTETAEQRSQRYSNTYQITNAVPETGDPLAPPNTMSDDQFDQVLRALEGVPANIMSQVTGIPIYRGLTTRGPHGEVAEYAQDRPAGSAAWDRKITVYMQFFRMNQEQQTFTMAHEIGHALDYRPNETAANRQGGASLSAATNQTSFRRAVRQDGGLGKGMSTYAATGTDWDEYYAEAFAMYLRQPETLEALRPHVHAYFTREYPPSP
jgi:hypothetical protein